MFLFLLVTQDWRIVCPQRTTEIDSNNLTQPPDWFNLLRQVFRD